MTNITPWSPTLLHDDYDTTTLLEQDVMVPITPDDTQVFHSVHQPPIPPKSTRYIIARCDDSTVASDDLTVYPDTNMLDFSQMGLSSASWMQHRHVPIVETVLTQSTSICAQEPVPTPR
jgi:hypothetical protein